MKNTFKFASLALLGALMALSCNKTVEEPVSNEPVMRTFTCTIAPQSDPNSKVSIAANGKTAWEVGDKILFHGKHAGGEYSSTVTLKAEDLSLDKKSFTVTIPSYTDPADEAKWLSYGYISNIYAAYPADAVVTTEQGDENWYGLNKFTTSNVPLMSGFNDAYNSGNITFYNLCGVISFVVDGDFDTYVLSGNDDETVAYDGYQCHLYKHKTSGDVFEWVKAGTAQTSVSGTVKADGSTINKVCIPNGANFTSGFKILFKKGSSIEKEVSVKPVNVTRNGYLPLGDVTSHLKDYVAPTSHDATNPAIAGATALDGSGTANCYVVDGSVAGNANKVFKFKAYKGNSTTSVGTIASVEVLWETYNNATDVTANTVIAAVDYDKQAANEYYEVVFKMPATLHAGNALIAAKNAGGTILWSWHIWVPETTIGNVDAGLAAANAIIDRNLGATIVMPTDGARLEALGMYYQWGRKDPLCGTKVKGAPTSAMKQYVSGAAASYETSIQNPTVFYYIESSNWFEGDAIATLWDNGDHKKTQYDPCPPGYKVPVFNATYPMWNKDGATFGTNWTWDGTNAYAKFNSATTAFPLGGYLNGTGQVESGYGTRAQVWSATAASTSRGNGMLLRDGAYNAINPYKSQGGNVRCVAE